jgi:hypothetical protein
MTAVLLHAWQDWECPNCGLTERTRPIPPNAARFHPCPRLHMLKAPLVLAGSDCKIEVVEREEYLGAEIQRSGDDGRPYAGVRTEYADGHNDLAVYAPLAYGSVREML